jgi:DNA-binding CsgD family transcriptional regulator
MDNQTEEKGYGPSVMMVKFSDVEIPEFKEVPNKDHILYGKNNLYPQYLTYLYNKSAKHGAIINGKSKYIFGGGFMGATTDEIFKLPAINREGETWNDVAKKCIKDVEIYGGSRLMVIWSIVSPKPADIFHIEFEKLRKDKDGGFLYKNNWADHREQAQCYEEFDPNDKTGIQIFEYNEYRPGTNIYPLPEYLACNNYIETDIEISKFHLSSIRNGMMPSKAIEFFIGDPSDEKKREIERRFEKKFSGAENAGKFVMIFNTNKDKSVNITDLSASELDKQFDLLNKTCQQEIFTGHQVTSPMLFGIKEEGQLGGATELFTAYQIFINTYAKPKQQDWEKIVNYFQSISGLPADLYIAQLDPIGNQIDIKDVVNSLPKEYVFTLLDIPKDLWDKQNIGADNRPTPTIPIAAPDTLMSTDAPVTNDAIRSLTAKQHQQLMRIIRQYSKNQLTKEAATVLLKTGLGLTDDDINSLLGIEEDAEPETTGFSSQKEDHIIQLFNKCGDLKTDFHIVKSKKINFSSDDDAADDEINFFTQAFKESKVTISEQQILDLIKADKLITPEAIASALNTTEEYVAAKIAGLIKKGSITTSTQTVGTDTQIIREVSDNGSGDNNTPDSTQISVKYSYEGPQDSRNRPFCAKLMDLNRLYSRFEIEQISQQLGYSVFDRRGGFWMHKDGVITPYCRHNWQSNIVVKKGGNNVA